MNSQRCLIRIRLQSEDDVFLLSGYEPENSLSLKLVDVERNEAYVGEISDIQLKFRAIHIRLTYDDFKRKISEALFENSNDSSYRYSLDENEGKLFFKWKSVDAEETVITLGVVQMFKRNSVYIIAEVLKVASEQMWNLSTRVSKLSTELDDAKHQASEALEQLSIANNIKQKLEQEMFSKFVLVLNEKKRKIRELEQNIKSNSDSGNTKSNSSTNRNDRTQRKKSKRSHHIKFSESSEEVDDIDMAQPGPSTQIKKEPMSFFDETESIVPASQTRIRNRKARTIKKECTAEALDMNANSIRKNKNVIKEESDEFLLDDF